MGGRANVGGTWGVNNYKSCAGGNWNWGDHVGVVQPSGPYPNSNNGLDQGNGIICRNSGNDRLCYEKLANITDGTSTTFAVGECVPAWSTHSWWFWFNAATATCGIPLNYRIENGDQWMSTAAQAGDWTRNYSFFSRHPGGAQFAMCDASTRFISNSVDLIVYRATATISGGEAVKLP
jgi:prepilin-type processing-associated H-X9-DG protein